MLTFQFLSEQIKQNKTPIWPIAKRYPFGTWQFGKIGVLVNLIFKNWKVYTNNGIQKLKRWYSTFCAFIDLSYHCAMGNHKWIM